MTTRDKYKYKYIYVYAKLFNMVKVLSSFITMKVFFKFAVFCRYYSKELSMKGKVINCHSLLLSL